MRESHPMRGIGTSSVKTPAGAIKLKEVKYVLSMKKKLISMGTLADNGHIISFSHKFCWIIDENRRIVALGKRNINNGLYSFDPTLHAHAVVLDK